MIRGCSVPNPNLPHFLDKTPPNDYLVHMVQQFFDVLVSPERTKYYDESITPSLRLGKFCHLFMPSQFS